MINHATAINLTLSESERTNELNYSVIKK